VVDGVAITSRDGVQLKGTYFSPGQPGPGIVLFHQCDGNGRRSWGAWPRDLAAAGFHVLTFDNRGVGDSQRGRESAATLSGDADAVYSWLASQPGVDKTHGWRARPGDCEGAAGRDEITAVTDPRPPLVGVIMGSKSDWETMSQAAAILAEFGVPHETRVVSAHRTPQWMAEYAMSAATRGLEVIVAGAGGAAHLPGMVAAHTVLPVIGVPVQSAALNGLDSLLSIVQMPKGVPVATVAIGTSGAVNAGLLAVAILATSRPDLRMKLQQYRDRMTADVRAASLP
jgi:5-(carboxyamino)imidazole ribonucleotide mutase